MTKQRVQNSDFNAVLHPCEVLLSPEDSTHMSLYSQAKLHSHRCMVPFEQPRYKDPYFGKFVIFIQKSRSSFDDVFLEIGFLFSLSGNSHNSP